MNEQSMTLDLRKTGFGKRVVIRQNDYHGITLAVEVTDGSKAYSVPAAAKCCLMARMLGSYVRDGGCTVEGGRIVYTADERMFGASGTAEAYFRIEVDGAAYSTEGFQLVVERAADSYAQLSKTYDTEVDRAIRDAGAAAEKADDAAEGAKAAGGRADAAAKKAGEAAAKAEAWAGEVDAATDAANIAAEKAEAAAQQATAAANKVFPAADNVLTGSASGAVAHAEDAFEGAALRGIAVEGACRQDGVPSPENPVPIEVVESPVVTLTGRNMLDFGFPAYKAAYSTGIAVVRTDYLTQKTVSLPYTTPTSSSGFGFIQKLAAGTYALKAFNLKTDKHTVYIAGYATEADVCNHKKCIWSYKGQPLGSQVSFTVQDGGECVVFCFAAKWDDGTNKATYPVDFKVSVELAEPAEYRPYTSQFRAFALPAEHPYLAKLPDGTADEIVVDEAGNVELVASVGKLVLDGDSLPLLEWQAQSNGYSVVYRNVSDASASINSKKFLSDNLRIVTELTSPFDKCAKELGNVYFANNKNLCVGSGLAGASQKDAVQAVNGWLNEHNATVYYALDTPKTYALGRIDMPKAQDSIVNAWTDAEVTPSTSIRYIRDVSIVIANIESAIASITQG